MFDKGSAVKRAFEEGLHELAFFYAVLYKAQVA